MARLIITLVLLFGLIGTAFWEQSFIGSAYTQLETKVAELTETMTPQDDIQTDENMQKTIEMYDFWLEKEQRLSIIAKHSELAQISDAIIYVKNFVEFGIKEEAFAGIRRLNYLIRAQRHNFAVSFPNAF